VLNNKVGWGGKKKTSKGGGCFSTESEIGGHQGKGVKEEKEGKKDKEFDQGGDCSGSRGKKKEMPPNGYKTKWQKKKRKGKGDIKFAREGRKSSAKW